MGVRNVILRYRAIAAALVVAIVLLVFVFAGHLDPSRAAITIGICWVLAMHSADNSAVKEELRREIVAAHAAGITSLRVELADGLKEIAAAGIQFRTGQSSQAVAMIEEVAEHVCDDIRKTRAAEAQLGPVTAEGCGSAAPSGSV